MARPTKASAHTRPEDRPSYRAVVPVTGMTCRTCEVRIQKHVGAIPSVRRVAASAARGQVIVES